MVGEWQIEWETNRLVALFGSVDTSLGNIELGHNLDYQMEIFICYRGWISVLFSFCIG